MKKKEASSVISCEVLEATAALGCDQGPSEEVIRINYKNKLIMTNVKGDITHLKQLTNGPKGFTDKHTRQRPTAQQYPTNNDSKICGGDNVLSHRKEKEMM